MAKYPKRGIHRTEQGRIHFVSPYHEHTIEVANHILLQFRGSVVLTGNGPICFTGFRFHEYCWSRSVGRGHGKAIKYGAEPP